MRQHDLQLQVLEYQVAGAKLENSVRGREMRQLCFQVRFKIFQWSTKARVCGRLSGQHQPKSTLSCMQGLQYRGLSESQEDSWFTTGAPLPSSLFTCHAAIHWTSVVCLSFEAKGAPPMPMWGKDFQLLAQPACFGQLLIDSLTRPEI